MLTNTRRRLRGPPKQSSSNFVCAVRMRNRILTIPWPSRPARWSSVGSAERSSRGELDFWRKTILPVGSLLDDRPCKLPLPQRFSTQRRGAYRQTQAGRNLAAISRNEQRDAAEAAARVSLDQMADLLYVGLPEFGLPLVTPGMPTFASLLREMESRPGPGPFRPALKTDHAAILLNQSGKAIVALDIVWHYATGDGQRRASRLSTLGSSVQREVLSGRAKVERDLGTFILPGSKRLITERGIFGNNLDVLSPDEVGHAQGYCGVSGTSGSGPGEADPDITRVELILDLVVLEDGLCVGPDESGVFAALNECLAAQCTIAQEALAELRKGASEGRIFDIMRPLVRHDRPAPGDRGAPRTGAFLLQAFGSEAIQRLIHSTTPELLGWFERAAQPPLLELRRP